MDSGSRVHQGTVFATATLSYCDTQCTLSVRDAREVTLTRDAANLDSTSTLALRATGTVQGGAPVKNEGSSAVMGQATVDVIVRCETGLHAPYGGPDVRLYQSGSGGTTSGYGGTSDTPQCDGMPQTFSLPVNAWNGRFHPGVALAIAELLLCPVGQTVSPGGSGPGCRRISEAAEIQLVR